MCDRLVVIDLQGDLRLFGSTARRRSSGILTPTNWIKAEEAAD